MALFLGAGLVIFRGLAALGMVLLVFGPRKANEERLHHEDNQDAG